MKMLYSDRKSLFSKIISVGYRMKFIQIFIIFAFLAASLNAQQKPLRTADDRKYSYTVVEPVGFDSSRKYILVVCLHGLRGNSAEMAGVLSNYTRYMNMILLCIDGNIPDPERNARKWGYSESESYILGTVHKIRSMYNLMPETLLIGYSQGASQALLTAVRNPDLFPYSANVSGGNITPDEKNSENVSKLKVLFLAGDTGDAEKKIKQYLSEKAKLFSKKTDTAFKSFKNHKHDFSHHMAYASLKWYMEKSRRYGADFWMNKGDYLSYYEKGEALFEEGQYEKSRKYFRKSISINPFFPPAALSYTHAALMLGNMSSFTKSFFPSLELYSSFPFFEEKRVFTLFSQLNATVSQDEHLQKFLIRFLSDKIEQYVEVLHPAFAGEVYFTIFRFAIRNSMLEEAKTSKKKAMKLYSKVDKNSSIYNDADIGNKMAELDR